MAWMQKYMTVTELAIRQRARSLIADLAVGEMFCIEAGGILYLYRGNGQCIYFYAIHGKEYTETFKEDLEVYPCTDIPVTEIKVRLHHTIRDIYLEVWQSETINKKTLWLGRYTYGPHLWYYLSDAPYGYCEPVCHINPSIEFICCDKDWKEVLRDSNNAVRHSNRFPSLEELCRKEWAKIKDKYPDTTKDCICDWLDAKMPEDVSYDDKINWRSHRYAIIDPDNIIEGLDWIKRVSHPAIKTETIHSFQFMHETYKIVRIAKKHLLCDALWWEYIAVCPDSGGNYACWYAYEYDTINTNRIGQ